MTKDLLKLGFEVAPGDPCLFLHRTRELGVCLHVDDQLAMAKNDEEAAEFFGPNGIGKGRTMTYGPLRDSLNMDFEVEYTNDRRSIFVSQPRMARAILERAGLGDCNSVQTPAVPGRRYTKGSAPADEDERRQLAKEGLTPTYYNSITAAVNYLVAMTRKDMLFAVAKLSKYCRDPGRDNYNSLKHMLRFLKGTADYGVQFLWKADDPKPDDGPLTIEGYSDSSYCDDIDTAKSTEAHLIKVNGATVDARCKLGARVDSCVNHSETGAFLNIISQPKHVDTNTATDGGCESMMHVGRSIVWVRGIKAFLERRDVDSMPPTKVHVDNAGVLAMIKDSNMRHANKHIYRTIAEARERVNVDKCVFPCKIHTKLNLANALTKQEPCLKDSAEQLRQIAGPVA